ncbi:GumC family protein [Planctomycetota bacterium]
MEFLKIWETVVRRKWIIIITFSVFFATVVIGTYFATPLYEAKAKMLVKSSEGLSSLMNSLNMTGNLTSRDAGTDDADYDTEVELMTIRPILESLISKLNIKNKNGEILKPEQMAKPSLLGKIFAQPSVEVEQYRETDILMITSNSTSPEEAVDMSNELAKIYIENRIAQTRQEYNAARMFIENRIGEIRDRYYGSLLEKRDFMIKEETIDLEIESKDLLERISTLQKDYRDNEIAIAGASEKIFFLEEKVGERKYASSTLIDHLESRLSDISAEFSGKRVELTLEDPEVLALNQQMETLKKILNDRAQIILAEKQVSVAPVFEGLIVNLKDAFIDKKVREIKRDLLKEYIDKAKDDLIKIPSKVIKQSKLELALSNYRDVYGSLLEYLTQVGIAEAVTISNIKLVEPAIVPRKPDFPKKVLNYIAGTFFGFFLAFSLAFFRDYVDDTIHSPASLGDYRFTFLGSIRRLRMYGRRFISKTDPNDPLFEDYRKIVSAIQFTRLNRLPKRLLVSSIEPKSGSSTVATNLGIIYAKEGAKVLLIDTDLRRPNLQVICACSQKEGLTNVLLENKEVEKVICKSRIDGLSVLPAGPIPFDAGLLLRSKKFHDVIQKLQDKYDVLIFDSAPLLIKDDAISLMSYLDSMVIVLRNKKTTHKAICKMDRFLQNAKITPTGVVLNCA